MDHIGILKLINEVEQKFNVDEWRVNDYRIWPIIRIKLAFILYAENNPKSEKIDSVLSKAASKKIFQQLNKYLNWENRSLKHRIDNSKIKRKLGGDDTVAFFTMVANRTLLDNEWHNRSIDPIVDILKEKNVNVKILEFTFGLDYKYPRYNDDICINFEDIFKFNVSLSKTGKEINNFHLEGYDDFLKFLNKVIPDVDIKSLTTLGLKPLLISFSSYVDYFHRILSESKVKICFTTCYYDTRMMALIAACKKLNILTVELPHGTHGDTHAAFGKWEKVPKEGYAVLPDVFWCWSDNEKNAIDTWINKQGCKHEAIIGGNAWLEMWNNENKLSLKINSQFKSLAKKADINILLSLQPFNVFDLAMPTFLLEAIRQSPSGWKWWIRLHPRQPQTIEEFQKALIDHIGNNDFSKVNIKEATDYPLPALLKNMNVHITIFSSVVVEAAEMGVPSVVLSQNGQSIFKSLVKPEMLYLAEANADGVLEAVKVQTKNKCSDSSQRTFAIDKLDELMKRGGIA